jgi:SAM-dependent methyltransferase
MAVDMEALQRSDWYYDDMRHVGVDFSDPVQVATYDARQRSTDAAAAALLDELGLQSGQVFADLGCGTGVLACQAALKGCEVRAIDISAQMLDATRKRAEILKASGITVQQAGFPRAPEAHCQELSPRSRLRPPPPGYACWLALASPLWHAGIQASSLGFA